ncbi:Putative helicase nuclease [Orpheovirus IHUMI-LCC2]|uniref:Helicase nuclease n=1 Tax=Orpheovirus IHUMI-LCC2 TaxID=2023057 RepID=A0A2I2L5A9_9VIRU|nr:Putative helicase nuclease [Orpheovirus IHUMI-LCC2]SNW62732.1 Putative helicase nuclease [Orpheovirus IHUMI-LCC2]
MNWIVALVILLSILFLLWIFFGGNPDNIKVNYSVIDNNNNNISNFNYSPDYQGRVNTQYNNNYAAYNGYTNNICTEVQENSTEKDYTEEYDDYYFVDESSVCYNDEISQEYVESNPNAEGNYGSALMNISNVGIDMSAPPYGDGKPKNRYEKIVCETLSKIYGKHFYTTRPNFLKTPDSRKNLEIDCYNPDLRIGGEVNGEQHYKFPNRYHDTIEKFKRQVWNDRFKINRCDQLGIYLVRIPYNINYNKIPEYVVSKIDNSMLPHNFDKEKFLREFKI